MNEITNEELREAERIAAQIEGNLRPKTRRRRRLEVITIGAGLLEQIGPPTINSIPAFDMQLFRTLLEEAGNNLAISRSVGYVAGIDPIDSPTREVSTSSPKEKIDVTPSWAWGTNNK